jgi:hypothetical protein
VTANQVLDGFKMAGFQRCSLRREEFLLQGYGLEKVISTFKLIVIAKKTTALIPIVRDFALRMP